MEVEGKMKKWKTIFVVSGITLALSAICGAAHLRESSHRGEISPQLDKAAFAQKTQKLQMPFIANNGQVDEQVEFYAKTFGGTVFVTRDGEIVYALPKTEKSECRLGEAERTQQAALQSKTHSNSPNPKSAIQNLSSTSIGDLKSGVALREEFLGARVKTIQGEDPSVIKVNYFKGNDPSKWKTNVSTYNLVNLGEIYKGIELKLKAYGDNVEKLFCVKPKSNPDQIKVQLSGAKSITVNEEGQLEVETELGYVKFTKPIAYQEIDGKRAAVECEYMIADCGMQNAEYKTNPQSEFRNPQLEYGFKVAAYDKTKDLIIDPLLASTYLGGISYNRGNSLALDTSGNVYVTGYTSSFNFPTTSGAYDTSYSGGVYADVFVSKLDGELTSLLASTFLGGGDYDWGYSLTLDASGNVYVTGYTKSSDFPTTSGAYDTSLDGDFDAFISKLDSNLSASATTPIPTPTSGCEVGEITLSENKLTLSVGTSKDVTVTLTGKDGCIPEGVTIKTEINTAGRKRISVSPENVRANDSGEATFIITAKKKGSALLTFKSDGMKKKLIVKVKK